MAKEDSAESQPTLSEVAVLLAAMILLPPLIAFAAYFCLWHSPRQTLHFARPFDPHHWPRALRSFAAAAAPMTAGAAGCAMIAFLSMQGGSPLSIAGLQVLFVGVAALTVPHMLVTALREARPAGRPEVRAAGRPLAPATASVRG